MSEFWDEMYQKIGTNWQFEPADSTIFTRNLFAENGIRKILIPGVGYGRNARLFVEGGFELTGIEISETAIQMARQNGLNFPIHHGSVLQMPFDDSQYDGIYCYALIHLLDQNERRQFVKNCYNQLKTDGMMVFVMVSKEYTKLHNDGKRISHNRYRIQNGLEVFFYDQDAVEREFIRYGLVECSEVDEPVKHLENEAPMKFWRLVCRKNIDS
jgi:SAM-dependent methyltransferase